MNGRWTIDNGTLVREPAPWRDTVPDPSSPDRTRNGGDELMATLLDGSVFGAFAAAPPILSAVAFDGGLTHRLLAGAG